MIRDNSDGIRMIAKVIEILVTALFQVLSAIETEMNRNIRELPNSTGGIPPILGSV